MSIMEDIVTRKVNAQKANEASRLAAENASLKHGLAGILAKEGWMSSGTYDQNGSYYRHPVDGDYNMALNYIRSVDSGAAVKNTYDPAIDYMESEPDVSRDYPRAKEYIDEVNQAAIADMIAKNRAYQADRKSAEFTQYPKNTGRYDRVSGVSSGASDEAAIQGGADPVTNGIAQLQAYLLNKPIDRANEYVDNINPGLAAMWQSSYK